MRYWLRSALMAFAVTREGLWRLTLFLTPSFFAAASVANWSPLLVAAAFEPVLFPLAIAKPTLAAVVMLNFPNRRDVYSVYEVEWEIQRAHPDLDIGFTVINLADVDRQVALGAIPSGAKSLLPLRA